MTHSKFPWTNHPHTPTAVFDGDGRRIIDQWVAPEGWSPIETAPKDGSEILVWRPHENSDHPAHIGIDLWKMYDSKGVWWRSRPGQFPTHWRPLPTPPSSAPAPTPLAPETAAANAVMIAAIPEMLAALRGLSKMYSHAWDSVDGNLVMLGPSIERFEKAHHEAQKVLCAIDGVPMPICDDEDDAALASIGRTL